MVWMCKSADSAFIVPPFFKGTLFKYVILDVIFLLLMMIIRCFMYGQLTGRDIIKNYCYFYDLEHNFADSTFIVPPFNMTVFNISNLDIMFHHWSGILHKWQLAAILKNDHHGCHRNFLKWLHSWKYSFNQCLQVCYISCLYVQSQSCHISAHTCCTNKFRPKLKFVWRISLLRPNFSEILICNPNARSAITRLGVFSRVATNVCYSMSTVIMADEKLIYSINI